MTRLDVVNFISHGIAKTPQEPLQLDARNRGRATGPAEDKAASPLESFTNNLNPGPGGERSTR
jgi:ATP-dependent Clp protease ATP-binding subunit ClpA